LDEVIIHLSELGGVELLQVLDNGICITVQYKTRADAELAATKGAFFHNKKLIVVWQKNDDEMSLLSSMDSVSLSGGGNGVPEELKQVNGDHSLVGGRTVSGENVNVTDDKTNAAQEPSSDNLQVNGTADGGSVQGKRKRSKEAEDDLLYSDDENQQNTVSQDDDNDEILLGDEDEGGRNWRT